MTTTEALPTLSAQHDAEQKRSFNDEKHDRKSDSIEIAESLKGDVYDDLRIIDMDENGKERPIGMFSELFLRLRLTATSETDVDIATRLISLEDEPTLPAFTFRMWFLGLGLACFGSVLGQIFVGSSLSLLNLVLTIDRHYYPVFQTTDRIRQPVIHSDHRLHSWQGPRRNYSRSW